MRIYGTKSAIHLSTRHTAKSDHYPGCGNVLQCAKEEKTVTLTGEGTMKKAILLIAAALVLFNFSTAFAQDEDIKKALKSLQDRLILNGKRLTDARGNLWAIAETIQDENQVQAIVNINRTIIEAELVHKYLIPIAMLSQSIREDKLKFYRIIYDALLESKQDLDSFYNEAQIYYPYLEKKSLLDTTDKIKEILRDTIKLIEITLNLLSKITGSSQ